MTHHDPKPIIARFNQVGFVLTVTASCDNGKITATAVGDCPAALGPAWHKRLDDLVAEAGGKVRAQIAASQTGSA